MSQNPFHQHLQKIRAAKSEATLILDITNPGHHEAETTLALAWESLFDHFCINKKPTLTRLNTISSIIHKLTAAYTQIKTLEIKSRELLLKEESYKSKKEELEAIFKNKKDVAKSLTPEELHHIEQQLKLL